MIYVSRASFLHLIRAKKKLPRSSGDWVGQCLQRRNDLFAASGVRWVNPARLTFLFGSIHHVFRAASEHDQKTPTRPWVFRGKAFGGVPAYHKIISFTQDGSTCSFHFFAIPSLTRFAVGKKMNRHVRNRKTHRRETRELTNQLLPIGLLRSSSTVSG
jgi:hypothetical protein